MTIELVTYADLKALLGLTQSLITGYPALGVIRDSVVYAIEDYIGRKLEKDDRTETIYIGVTPSQMISLPAIPVVTVATVTVTQGQTDTVYASTDYDIEEYGIKLAGRVSNAKVVVVYNGGLEVAAIPTSITRAALLQTAYEWQAKDQIGATSTSTEGGSVQRPELGLLKEVKRLLNKHKHPLKLT